MPVVVRRPMGFGHHKKVAMEQAVKKKATIAEQAAIEETIAMGQSETPTSPILLTIRSK